VSSLFKNSPTISSKTHTLLSRQLSHPNEFESNK
jgi:hypothetical protein